MLKKLFSTVLIFLSFYLPAGGQTKTLSDAETHIQKSLNKFCVDCHDDELSEGKIRLDDFSTLKDDLKFELLNKVEEQLYLELMPPKDKKKQPSKDERQAWLDAIKNWNETSGKSSLFRGKLGSPDYGNYLSHEKLFSGEYKDLPGFTYDRRWIISEFIFSERINTLLKENELAKMRLDGKNVLMRGIPLPLEIANPFLLPVKSGIRYHANDRMNSGHLKTMIGNSKHISDAMINSLSTRFKDYLPAVASISSLSQKNDAALAERNYYLSNHIDRICADIYKNENEALLPKYTQIKLIPENELEKSKYFDLDIRGEKRWRNFVKTANGRVVEMTLIRFIDKAAEKEKFFRLCEKYWVHLGYDRKMVETLLIDMQINLHNYLLLFKDNKHPSVTRKMSGEKIDSSVLAFISETIKKVRKQGMSYKKIQEECIEYWRNENHKAIESAGLLTPELRKGIIYQLYEKIYERQPSSEEFTHKDALLLSYSSKIGVNEAVTKLTQTLLLDTEFINRNEYGAGKADAHGRRMLSPRDASYAIAYALTDSSPDEQLARAAREGKLNSKEDYKREIVRLLKDRSRNYIIDNVIQSGSGGDNITSQPIRKLRFFREFFGYYTALKVFKDEYRLGYKMDGTRERMIAEADMLVDYILENDKNVFEELLTTDKFYVFHNGDNKSISSLTQKINKAYSYFQKNNWKQFKSAKDLAKHKDFLTKEGVPGLSVGGKGKGGSASIDQRMFQSFISLMTDFERRFKKGEFENIAPVYTARLASFGPQRRLAYGKTGGFTKYVNGAYFYNINPYQWDYPAVQPAKVENRMGMLTHPAWLQAFSQNTHTDPVTRGKWIREKLLAGTIPDVPIGVEAQIPDDHTRTLRDRLKSVTEVKECWKCHQLMNPLGNTLEMYDDLGRYRTEEELEHPDNILSKVDPKKKTSKAQPVEVSGARNHLLIKYKTLPVDSSGVLEGTGDSKLDGKVKDGHDLIKRLVKAPRVRQSIIRHAFRYFLGRNEMLSDSKTLIDAEEAYLKSGGSFDAVIVSLLSSDSFIYRKEVKE